MRLLRVIAALGLAAGLQTVLGRVWADGARWVDFMLLPVVWYGIVAGQRSAMLAGCAAGLLQDAWFQVGVFGLNGFKWTFLGWALGSLGTRFDLNHAPGRLLAGALVGLADGLLDLALRRILDLQQSLPAVRDMLIRSAVTAVLAFVTFGLIDRFRRRDELRRLAG